MTVEQMTLFRYGIACCQTVFNIFNNLGQNVVQVISPNHKEKKIGYKDAEAFKRINEVLNAPNTEDIYTITGVRYYFSSFGDDNNDGLTPETPLKSLNKLNNKGEFILTLAQATDSSDDSYYLTVDGTTVEIPCHVSVYYDIDNKGGIYTYIAENSVGVYKMVYFSSVEDFSVAMSKLSRALYFSELLDYVPDILPWILISAVGIILIMAKHKWRNIDAE